MLLYIGMIQQNIQNTFPSFKCRNRCMISTTWSRNILILFLQIVYLKLAKRFEFFNSLHHKHKLRYVFGLSAILSINSYTFSLDSANLRILFFLFVPFCIDLAEPRSTLSCRCRQPPSWCQSFQCYVQATCQSFWV